MAYVLGKRSLDNLEGVNYDLQKVVKKAIKITKQDFTVIEGVRTKERQKELYEAGFSKTMNSRHLTGHAVDIVPYPIPEDWSEYSEKQWGRIAEAMLCAAEMFGVDLEWGYAEWGWDKPHFQLSRKSYL